MQVHLPSKSLVLKLRNPDRVLQHIPRARMVNVGGDQYTQVRFGLDEAKVLRNLGIAAPSPIRYFYDWPSKYPRPMAHQVTTAEFFTLHQRCICLNDMGTAKTLSAIWAADYMMSLGQVRKAIIVCPKSTMNTVWLDEIRSNLLSRRSAVVLSGSRALRLKRLREDVDFYIINHDGVKVIRDELAKRSDINLWIYDEASVLRNSRSDRHKVFVNLLPPAARLWMLTGTPCPKEPTDVWGLAKILGNPDIPRYFTAFRHQLMLQITPYKWIPKEGAYEMAYAALKPSIRFRKSECIDLPPVTFTTLMADLTEEQRKAYEGMKKQLVAEVRGTPITAAHAATKMQKLVQVAMGAIYDEHGDVHFLDSTPRLTLLNELVEGTNNKTIVFVPYTRALDMVANYLREQGHTVAVVDGRTSDTTRREIFDAFQTADDPQVLVAHPKTAAHGLTLTRADLTVWYGPVLDMEIFEQANNRMDRPGQTNAMTIACIASSSTELELYSALKAKQLMQNTILGMFKNELELPNQ